MEWNNIDAELIIDELEKGLGEGPLTLLIHCTKCQTQFDLNKEAVAMATLMNASFIEYLRYVQSSKCTACQGIKYAMD